MKSDKQNFVYVSGARVSALAQGPPYTPEDGGGGDEGAASQGHINDFFFFFWKSAFGDWLPADRAFEIQNNTLEVMSAQTSSVC